MPLAMITVPPSVLSIGYSLLAHLLLNRYKWLYTEVFILQMRIMRRGK
jgi:hypothetical protein